MADTLSRLLLHTVQADNSEREYQLWGHEDATRSDLSELDTRKAEKAVCSNTDMEALGKVNGTEK